MRVGQLGVGPLGRVQRMRPDEEAHLREDPAPGPHFAVADDNLIGWLNAQARHLLPHCFGRLRIAPTPLPCEPFEAAVIVCFIISPPWRKRGVARALLAAALPSLASRGLKLVDAFPFKSGASELPADHYHGPLSLFLSEGFSILREEESMTVVRKLLT